MRNLILLAGRRPPGAAIRFLSWSADSPCRGGDPPPAAGFLPSRRRCEASRRWFRRRRRCETKRSDLGRRFSFFSHSFFCKKKKEWEKEKTCPLRWIFFAQRDADAALGQCSFFSWKERALRERTAFRVSEGFFCPISAHGRSLRSL